MQLLWLRRESEERVNFALEVKSHRFLEFVGWNPIHIPSRIYADVAQNACDPKMVDTSYTGYRDSFTFEVSDGIHTFVGKQFPTPYMNTSQHNQWPSGIDRSNRAGGSEYGQIYFALPHDAGIRVLGLDTRRSLSTRASSARWWIARIAN